MKNEIMQIKIERILNTYSRLKHLKTIVELKYTFAEINENE